MKLAILIISALSTVILFAIAGLQLARLCALELADLASAAWRGPQVHS